MRYVLVTGSNSGIGLGIIKYLMELGYGIIAHYHKNSDNIDELFSVSKNKHYKVQADIRDSKQVKEMFSYIKENKIDLYGIINNAGIAKDKMILWLNESDWDDVIDLNLKGSFFCIKNAVPLMIRKKRGRIINIVSPSGILGREGQANYSSSKGGLIALTKAVAKEIAPLGITVNAVCPGIIKTRMYEDLKDSVKELFLDAVPLKRPGETREVAGIVEYLLRDDASYITGTILRVDGGLTIS